VALPILEANGVLRASRLVADEPASPAPTEPKAA
jgi:hypothetical protein